MSRFPRQSAARPRRRDGLRQAIVVIAFGLVLALGLIAVDDHIGVSRKAAAVARATGDDEIYTGSILHMPDEGRICHQVLFDNQTGRFTDNGLVDCERAAYHSTREPAKQWSNARVHVISSGFRQR